MCRVISGLGTSHKNLKKDQGQLEEVKSLYKKVPYFRHFMSNSIDVLIKMLFEIDSYIERVDKEYGAFWTISS